MTPLRICAPITIASELLLTSCAAGGGSDTSWTPDGNPEATYNALRYYAAAACLAALPDAALKDQGERWAGALLMKNRGEIEIWTSVANTVDMELARMGIEQGYPESLDKPTVPLPVKTCGEIASRAAVRAAIETAAKWLPATYQPR